MDVCSGIVFQLMFVHDPPHCSFSVLFIIALCAHWGVSEASGSLCDLHPLVFRKVVTPKVTTTGPASSSSRTPRAFGNPRGRKQSSWMPSFFKFSTSSLKLMLQPHPEKRKAPVVTYSQIYCMNKLGEHCAQSSPHSGSSRRMVQARRACPRLAGESLVENLKPSQCVQGLCTHLTVENELYGVLRSGLKVRSRDV